MNEIVIRHVEPGDHHPIISVVDAWWGGGPMADLLPKLFFVHFRSTSFTAVVDGQIVGFLIGFVSQTYPDQANEHFFATAASLGCRTVHGVTLAVGYEREGEDRVIFTKNLDPLDIVQ